MPIGSIILWASYTIPDGWILCNGSSISGDEYEDLRNVLNSNVAPNIQGLSASVNYIIKYKFCIPGGIVPPPVETIYATFEDYDGSTLYIQELNSGETPTYSGETPSREPTYDPEEDLWTEYTFNGWEPAIGPINVNTTFTAQYSTASFRYVTKYVKESDTSIDSSKEYILVTNGSMQGDVIINANWNSGKYLNIYTGTMTEEAFISAINEFQIASDTKPSHFLSLEYNDSNYRLKDLDDNNYLIALSSGNTFATKSSDPSSQTNDWLWTPITDSTGVYLKNVGQNTRIIQYNSSSTRFAPYKNTMVNVYLFYKSIGKEYINRNRGAKLLNIGAKSLNETIYITNIQFVEGQPEPEDNGQSR